MYSIGIDIGSQATKSVVINDKKEIIATDVVLTGGNNSRSANTTCENGFISPHFCTFRLLLRSS